MGLYLGSLGLYPELKADAQPLGRRPRRPKKEEPGSLGGSVVERLPSAQGMILETQDQVPRRAPCMEPASPSACVSLSVSLMNK